MGVEVEAIVLSKAVGKSLIKKVRFPPGPERAGCDLQQHQGKSVLDPGAAVCWPLEGRMAGELGAQ